MNRRDLLGAGAALMCLSSIAPAEFAQAGPEPSKPDVRATIVSRQSEKAGGELADRDVEALDLSANGRYVAFETQARNLGGAPESGTRIYRYDTLKDRVLLVSRTRSGALDRASRAPSISANGRYVAFSSNADRWVKSYVFDAKRRRLDLVSRQSRADGNRPANRDSFISDISADGRTVAFGSSATNLGGSGGAVSSLYVRDLVTGVTEPIAKKGYSGDAELSRNGRSVAYSGRARTSNELFSAYAYDRAKRTVVPLTPPRTNYGYTFPTSITADGSSVGVFAAIGTNCCGYVADVPHGELTPVDAPARGSNGGSFLSGDGRYAVSAEFFRGDAGVRRTDLRTGGRLNLSANLPRPPGSTEKLGFDGVSVSADGSTVAFIGRPKSGARVPQYDVAYVTRIAD